MQQSTNLDESVLSTLSDRYLLFYVDETIYGLSLAMVLEIIDVPHITHLPRVAPYIKGIINLRGKVVPAIDLRAKFGLPERPYDHKTCIIVLDIDDMQMGLIVDRVHEVQTIEDRQLASPPTVGDVTSRYLGSVAHIDGRAILNIDVEKLFAGDLSPVVL